MIKTITHMEKSRLYHFLAYHNHMFLSNLKEKQQIYREENEGLMFFKIEIKNMHFTRRNAPKLVNVPILTRCKRKCFICTSLKLLAALDKLMKILKFFFRYLRWKSFHMFDLRHDWKCKKTLKAKKYPVSVSGAHRLQTLQGVTC